MNDDDTMFDHENEILYPHHTPTTLFQKGLLAIGSGLAAFFDPKRDGQFWFNIIFIEPFEGHRYIDYN